jgi:hypothetical protein
MTASPIYARLQATATKMMLSYGQQITLVQQGPSVYDPTTSKSTSTQTTYVGQGTLVDYSMEAPSITTIRGTEIQQGDKRLFLGTQATLLGVPVQMPQPMPDDTIIDSNGVVYNILATTTTDPSGSVPIVHELHIRGIPGG